MCPGLLFSSRLHGSCACCHNCCKVIWTSFQPPGKLYLLVVIHHLCLLVSFWQWSLSPGRQRFNIGVLSRDVHSTVSYSLCFGQLWLSVLIAICCMRKLCWWELRDLLIFSLPTVLLWSMSLSCKGSIVDVSLKSGHLSNTYSLYVTSYKTL